MKRFLFLFLGAILVVFLELTFEFGVGLNRIGIDFAVIVVVAMTTRQRFEDAVAFAGITGFLLDLLSDMRFGVLALSLLIIVQILYLAQGKINYDSAINKFLIIFASSLLFNFLPFLLNINFVNWIASALASALVGTVLVSWADNLFKRKKNVEIGQI